MTGNEYQESAMRTNDRKATERLVGKAVIDNDFKDFGGIFNACLGLSGEVGEFNDMIKKWIFHEKQLDINHAKKEARRYLLVSGNAFANPLAGALTRSCR